MNITIEKNKKGVIARIVEELTIQFVKQTHNDLVSVESIFKNDITLDLEKVTELDTSGIQLIIYLNKRLLTENKKAKFKVVNANDAVTYTMKLLSLEKIIA